MATSAVQQKKLARDAKMAAYNSTKTSAIEAGKMDTFILPETTQAINATAPTTTTQPKSTLTSQYENKAGYKNKPEGSGWTYNSLTDTWTGGVAPQTEEEQATALADVPYMEASQLGDTMFGENNPLAGKTGFTGAVVDEYEKRAAEDKKYQEEQNAKAKALEESDLKKLTGAGLDSIDAVTAAYGQGREGVQSAGRPETIRKYQDSIRTDITNAQTRFDSAQAARDNAQVLLDRAIQDGRAEIIEMRQTNLAQAEQQLRTEKLAVLDAEARAVDLSLSLNEDQRAREQQNAANLESFTSLVGQGVTLPTESIINFANQLNVPFQAAFDYYQGAEAIRADKNLSVEEKQIANQENYFKLQDTISGGALAVQKKVDYFTQLASSGLYSNDQLGALASAMDLNNSSNPVFQAEQRMNAADVKIKEYEAANLGNPPPVGSVERLDYDIKVLEKQKAQLEMQELYGTTGGAYVPTNTPKEGTNAYYENGQYVVTSDPNLKYSCAAGVNRLLGTNFGDKYTQKAGIVQTAINNGTGVSGADAALNPSMIKPGMIFVMPTSGNTAKWGHVGIVRSVNPETGKFTASEWNANGAMTQGGVLPGENNQTNTNQYNINQMYGFMQPPSAKLEGVNGGATDNWTPAQILNFNKAQSYANSEVPEGQEDSFNAFIAKKTSPSTPLDELLNLTVGGKGFDTAEDKTISAIEDTRAGLADLQGALAAKKTDKLNPILGVLQSANPWDTKAQEVQRLVDSLVPGAARGIFGEVGVLTDADIARYTKLFPSLKDTKDVQDVVFDMMNRSIQRKAESAIRTMAAGGVNVSSLGYLIPDIMGAEEIEFDEEANINKFVSGDVELESDVSSYRRN